MGIFPKKVATLARCRVEGAEGWQREEELKRLALQHCRNIAADFGKANHD